MAAPPNWNPAFRLLSIERLPDALRSLWGHVYISVAYSPGPPDQNATPAVELFFDLTAPDMPEEEQLRWQRVLGANGDLRLASSEYRSSIRNFANVLEQLSRRLKAHEEERS